MGLLYTETVDVSASPAASKLPAKALPTTSPLLFPILLPNHRRSCRFLEMASTSLKVAANISLRGLPKLHSMSGTKTSGLSNKVSRFLSILCCICFEAFFIPRTRTFLLRFLSPGKLTSAGGRAILSPPCSPLHAWCRLRS